jgi:hypothetical protein
VNSLRAKITTVTKINAPPTSVIGSSRSANSHAASRTVTTGSSVDSMAALVGPMRSRPARIGHGDDGGDQHNACYREPARTAGREVRAVDRAESARGVFPGVLYPLVSN